jgi:hypothetical protein
MGRLPTERWLEAGLDESTEKLMGLSRRRATIKLVCQAASLSAGLFSITACNKVSAPSPKPDPFVIIGSDGAVSSGNDLFVNTDQGLTAWASREPDGILAAYPAGQQFGFVAAVIAGNVTPGSRPVKDLSSYKSLQFEIRGAAGGESVEIGVKDADDPDNGTETKKPLTLTTQWSSQSFALSEFTSATLSRIYVTFEVVFNGPSARSAYFRNVRYVP